MIKKLLTGKKAKGGVGKAQIKITVIIIAYIILGVISLVAFTYYEVKAAVNTKGIGDYLICHSTGYSEDCQLDIVTLNNVEVLSIVVIILLPLLPIIAIIFSVDPKSCGKKKDKRGSHTHSRKMTNQGSSGFRRLASSSSIGQQSSLMRLTSSSSIGQHSNLKGSSSIGKQSSLMELKTSFVRR